jgi:hypothetical protein
VRGNGEWEACTISGLFCMLSLERSSGELN